MFILASSSSTSTGSSLASPTLAERKGLSKLCLYRYPSYTLLPTARVDHKPLLLPIHATRVV